MKIKQLLVLISLVVSLPLSAQHEGHDHEHHDHDHHHHQNELGIGLTAVYLPGEQEIAPGTHVHFIHLLGESRFGIGAGYERIFDEHGHNMIGLIGSYMLFSNFTLTLSPGIVFEDAADEFNPALHLEATYELSLGDFHFGPTVGIAYLPEHYHLGAGIHIAYGF